MLTVLAPAKINLTLEVLGELSDGYHEIRSVIQAITLCDTFHFEPGTNVSFKCNMGDWSAEESLVSRAVALLQQASGCSKGVAIEIEKRIPLASGLGGDSSDAAAVLKGLNQLWELNLPLEKLLEMARQLGSDVSFFLYGNTALIKDKGEIVTPLVPFPHSWLVLMLPAVPRMPNKTRTLYQSLTANHYTDGQYTRRLIDESKKCNQILPEFLFNTFENVAFNVFPGLDTAREHLSKMGVEDIHLAGSGPTLFTLMRDKYRADALYSFLKQRRIIAQVVETLPGLI